MIPEFLFSDLNEEQCQAVSHKDGPLLVLAGPGSGKTRVVTHRIAALLYQGVAASQIVALTFTNKAAEEMKHRLQTLAPDRFVWIGTFHKFCARMLRQYSDFAPLGQNFTIYDSHESESVIKNIIAAKHLPPGINAQKIAASISWAKNNLVNCDEYVPRADSQLGMVVSEIYPLYQKQLYRANAADFDDLLLHVAVLLNTNQELRTKLSDRYRYVLIDEYQDTNTVQYVIAKMLSHNNRNLAVTGDPDQSIYGWRGANIQNILEFENDFPETKVIRLERNYRSTPEVLAAADSVIVNNIHRKPKVLLTDKSSGNPIRLVRCYDQNDEAESIAHEIAEELKSGLRQAADYAIFFRVNSLSRNLEHALNKHKVPFQLVRGLEFFGRKEIKDIIAYLRLIYNQSDVVSFERVINEPTRGIGKTTLKKILQFADERGLTIMEAANNVDSISGINKKTTAAVRNFARIISKLTTAAGNDYPVAALINMVLVETSYREQFDAKESEEDQTRLENVEELLLEAEEFDREELAAGEDGLEIFLERAALVSDSDGLDQNKDKVSLMTLHAAKGLEFPVVYIIAIEEGILPHDRAQNELQVEEERRLFFVGITRAKQELRLSRAERRGFRGNFGTAIASRFLMELPKNEKVKRYNSTNDIKNTEIIDPFNNIKLIREQPTHLTIKQKSQKKQVTKKQELTNTNIIEEEDVRIDYDDEYVDAEVEY
ncbi:MAG: UvrD-helicase domain-containing protein [Planctomycetaceae bacterium]|jgi:DNA helicase-2/ATP-dependent DNA helicase PcrA|nr:UvrD-helicase domain-containing protein [Planctomycetaceae bacterium]